MSRQKQQHIVPKVYLRNFCDVKNKNQIYFYDIISDKTAMTNIDNVAQEKEFYSDISKEDKDYYEKYYSIHIEPELGKLLNHVIMAATMYNNTPLITDEHRQLLSKMLVFQMLRTRNARKLFREKADFVTKQLTTSLLKMPEIRKKKDFRTVVEKYRKLDENMFKELSLPATIDETRLASYCSLLDTMVCVFYDNFTNVDFITSDNPVVVKRMSDVSAEVIGIGVAGLGHLDCIIAYPINPRLTVILLHRDFLLTSGFREYENRKHPIYQTEIVQTLNSWHFLQASRQVYSKSPFLLS